MQADAMDTARHLIRGSLRFDTADGIYQDHFPGRPVVPGTLILQGFLTALADHGPQNRKLTVEKFQFKRFLAPGSYPYCIRLTRGEAMCALFAAGAEVAAGTLVLGAD
jgi:3-hydroxyacyl-[acyl-carrier-protein] dehydratase